MKRKQIVSAIETLNELCLLQYERGLCGEPGFRDFDVGLVNRLQDLLDLFDDEGNYRATSPIAENYAICLCYQQKYQEAIRLFELIIQNPDDILAIDIEGQPKPCGEDGKLGYEGTYRYARALLSRGLVDEAKKVFLEFVTKIPLVCDPVHVQDLRLQSLKRLQNMGISEFAGRAIEWHIETAKENTY